MLGSWEDDRLDRKGGERVGEMYTSSVGCHATDFTS